MSTENEQQEQVFDHCYMNRHEKDAQLSWRRLSDKWILVQYDPTKVPIENFGDETPVWAIFRPQGEDERDCVVIYGDPHVVYVNEQGKKVENLKTLAKQSIEVQSDNFKTLAKFSLENGDVLYFAGADSAGDLSEVYIQSKTQGSLFLWGKETQPEGEPQLSYIFSTSGLVKV